ncbi:MAG TPA: DsrE family protein, partial [Flavisolibacter sp.]|nr:DsrE family protein [Flavisolibacter sp.]
MKTLLITISTLLFYLYSTQAFAQTIVARSPVIPEADGYGVIPNAKLSPDPKRIYKAIFDATHAARDSATILPALNMAGSELNALGVCRIPLTHAKFVVVFHGAAIEGILTNVEYQKKYGISNPNLPVLSRMKKAGVRLFVCGQNLLAEGIEPATISKDVEVA